MIITYIIIFILLFLFEISYFKMADHLNIIDKPNQRSSHTDITLRGGGIISLVGAWLFFIISGFLYPWFLCGLTAFAGIICIVVVCPVSIRFRLII